MILNEVLIKINQWVTQKILFKSSDKSYSKAFHRTKTYEQRKTKDMTVEKIL